MFKLLNVASARSCIINVVKVKIRFEKFMRIKDHAQRATGPDTVLTMGLKSVYMVRHYMYSAVLIQFLFSTYKRLYTTHNIRRNDNGNLRRFALTYCLLQYSR